MKWVGDAIAHFISLVPFAYGFFLFRLQYIFFFYFDSLFALVPSLFFSLFLSFTRSLYTALVNFPDRVHTKFNTLADGLFIGYIKTKML